MYDAIGRPMFEHDPDWRAKTPNRPVGNFNTTKPNPACMPHVGTNGRANKPGPQRKSRTKQAA